MLHLRQVLAALVVLPLAGPVLADIGLPGESVITNPVPGQVFAPGVTNVAVGWTESADADSYELNVLKNGRAFDTLAGLAGTEAILDAALTPGYYTLFVRGSNTVGVGAWSSNVTFTVERDMIPDGTVSNRQPKVFKWTRSEPATQYRLRLLQYDKTTGKYVLRKDLWIKQPLAGTPKWTASKIPDGKFKWTITDFKNNRAGYTQAATFQVRNSGFTSWNDPALIPGTWHVLDTWRWSELTFYDNGTLRTTQPNGVSFTRARWYADEKTLTLISDVTEHCPYTVTATTLTFTTPSGNTHRLSRP